MHKILYIDCDGTLKNDKGEIDIRTKNAISKFIGLGNDVVLCTGRPRYYASKIAKQINCNGYLITSNGAEVYDNINKNVLKIKPITTEDFMKIYTYTQSNNIRIVAVSENKEFVTKSVRNDSQYLLPNNNREVKKLIQKNAIKQIKIIGSSKEKIQSAKNKLLRMSDTITVVNESDRKEEIWVTLGNAKTSKGSAMKFLTNYLNVNQKDTIAIGNDYNDISMFEVAGTSVAMENAEKSIKQKVDEITLSNNENGVAIYLEKIIKNNA